MASFPQKALSGKAICGCDELVVEKVSNLDRLIGFATCSGFPFEVPVEGIAGGYGRLCIAREIAHGNQAKLASCWVPKAPVVVKTKTQERVKRQKREESKSTEGGVGVEEGEEEEESGGDGGVVVVNESGKSHNCKRNGEVVGCLKWRNVLQLCCKKRVM